jgi:3-dehydroquinate dehydratase II
VKSKSKVEKNILVIHGPNLNLLGSREPDIYGRITLDEIDARLKKLAEDTGATLSSFQSNAESGLIDRIQAARLALRDALAGVAIPFIEVHLSNVFAREAFRRESYFSELAVGVISGLGSQGYEMALAYALQS